MNTMLTDDILSLTVTAMRLEAQGIVSCELRDPQGGALPAFTAGAHIDLLLPGGLSRSYSLVNPETRRDCYLVAVGLDAASRGGSRYIHERLRVGDSLQVRAPRNHFELDDSRAPACLIAGGIGITPMLPMLARLNALGRPWVLHYCARTRGHAAFLPELEALAQAGQGELRCNFDQEPGGRMLDLAAVVAGVPGQAHLYCCGPAPMIQAFEAACAGRPAGHVHVEHFGAAGAVTPAEGGYTVELSRSGQCFEVPQGRTILDVLLDAGVDVPYSCREGVCSTCETRVLGGEPDHRDLVLSDRDKASGKVMMICCSGSRSERLVLDL